MIDRIAGRYRSRWLQGYVRGKLGSDPFYAAVFAHLRGSPLPLLDLGCGIGLLSFHLRECGYTAPISGVDFDETKIAEAQRIAAPDPGLHFTVGDLTETLPESPLGHVTMGDLLHYLPRPVQQRLLAEAAERVAPGGLCLIRETPRDGSWRFRCTQLEEFLIHSILWMKTRAIHYPSFDELNRPFVARGFTVETCPLWGRTPFNSHFFVFRSPG